MGYLVISGSDTTVHTSLQERSLSQAEGFVNRELQVVF
jgi:hypothetical protein